MVQSTLRLLALLPASLVRLAAVSLQGPLIAAVKARDAGRVKELLDQSADPNARDAPPQGPTGLRGLFLAMLGRGPSTPRNQGKTALMLAAGNGDMASARFLLERGADVHAKDEHGRTAFAWTAGHDFGVRVRRMEDQAARRGMIVKFGLFTIHGDGVSMSVYLEDMALLGTEISLAKKNAMLTLLKAHGAKD